MWGRWKKRVVDTATSFQSPATTPATPTEPRKVRRCVQTPVKCRLNGVKCLLITPIPLSWILHLENNNYEREGKKIFNFHTRTQIFNFFHWMPYLFTWRANSFALRVKRAAFFLYLNCTHTLSVALFDISIVTVSMSSCVGHAHEHKIS